MKKELDIALSKDFPLTFARDTDGREPWAMFGFEVGDGWEPLLREAASKLEPLFKEAIAKDPEGYSFGYYRTSQIKEKFGTLRWYTSGTSDEMNAIITIAEEKSHITCEQCGKPGQSRGTFWYYTACLDHTEVEDLDSLEIVEKAYEDKEIKNENTVK